MSTPRRNDVIEYVKEKYGEVYQVRTISYVQDKSAVQRSAQALGIAPEKYIKMSKDINIVEDMPAKTKEQKEWKDLAMKFRGHIISYGCHASAVLVSPEDVCNWTAIEKQGDNMVVCHDFHQLEAQGLLKLDILGLETLDIIEQTKHRAGIDIDVAKIPVDDKTTSAMLRKGDTTGCFQIESNVMTNIIIRMNVKNVEDMSAVVALGRPGPLDSGMAETFLRRRNHQEPTVYDIPELEPILRDTEGVILYQEQIMQIAQKICGYSLGEADNLRRIIGRKVVDEMKPAVDDMIARGVKNGYTEAQMKRLTDNIITFAAYGFNHCLSGDTVIMRDANGCKPLTIREMYLTKNDIGWAKENGHKDLSSKYRTYGYGKALSISGDRIKKNDIVNIFYSGKNKVYKVETESGEFVKCTALHKIPTPTGMVYMKDLKVGDEVYRKGAGYELLTTRISSITYVGIEDVYDIEMAAPNHTVVVNNGLVVSNSHSAAYGMTAWATAYLKAHYPAAFMASLLDSNCKDKPKLASYILEAMHMGIKILPPQLSHHNCYSDYDEEGAYIILGLNCIAGVGNTQIPKDSPEDFKTFLKYNINMNKTVLSNLVKAGVFKGNRDEMLQYIGWAKDKRKSKGEFKYTPTAYNEQMEESKVLGMSFGDIFSKYKMDLVNNVDIFGYEVLNVKGRKTKTGKNMAFVKVRDNKSVHDLVIFNDRYKDIKAHNVYIMKVRNNRIFDFTEAKLA